MLHSSRRPTLIVYRREHCGLCDELRAILQVVLEERARRGELVPAVHEVEVTTDAALEARYGALLPVLAIGATELPLAMSARHVRTFLERAMPAVA